MLLEMVIHLHLFLTSGSILVNFLWISERMVPHYGSALWIEVKVDLSQQRRWGKPNPCHFTAV